LFNNTIKKYPNICFSAADAHRGALNLVVEHNEFNPEITFQQLTQDCFIVILA
jgi:hypothetical protein